MSQHQIELLLKSEIPIIVIETHEENQTLDLITGMRAVLLRPVFKWSLTEGLERP